MKNKPSKIVLIIIFLFGLSLPGKSIDTLKYCFSFNYYRDLSDTYDGGGMLLGEFKISKSWFGASLSYGYFQSYSVFKYKIIVEEINKSITIAFDEVSIMKTGSFSLILIPIQTKLITADIALGLATGVAKSSQFHDVNYSYSLTDNKFNYLYKNYELVKKTHFGYQVGLNISFSITKKLALQLNARIQDLSNGGSFFFVGSGLCFSL